MTLRQRTSQVAARRDGCGAQGGRTRRSGQALTEYLAVVAVVLALTVILTAVTPRRAGPIPINPLKELRALVMPPPRPRPVVTVPRPRATPVRRRATPRRRVTRPTILVPLWTVGP